jgi:hypothetical protein
MMTWMSGRSGPSETQRWLEQLRDDHEGESGEAAAPGGPGQVPAGTAPGQGRASRGEAGARARGAGPGTAEPAVPAGRDHDPAAAAGRRARPAVPVEPGPEAAAREARDPGWYRGPGGTGPGGGGQPTVYGASGPGGTGPGGGGQPTVYGASGPGGDPAQPGRRWPPADMAGHRDPLVMPVRVTERAVIGDQLRRPAVWCELPPCVSRYSRPGALGEADVQAGAVQAGWREDALGRLVCPQCQQASGHYWSPQQVRLWDRETAVIMTSLLAAAVSGDPEGAAGDETGVIPAARALPPPETAGWERPAGQAGRHRRGR